MTAGDRKIFTREILLGFWKVHILHHATEHPVVGQWMLAELRHHGYRVSPGTLYPLLKRLEQHGWLSCTVDTAGGVRARRYYRTTKRGRAVLEAALRMLAELRHEATSDSARHAAGHRRTDAPSTPHRPRPRHS
jgi:DNA-binding PadR family transcriptional regulator